MATTITIKTGALTAQRSYSNDTKSQDTLRRAAQALGIDPAATNQAKLDALLDNIVAHIQTLAQGQYAAETSNAVGLE